MAKNIINWTYGENESQKYYDAYVGKDYLCVFANKWQPDIWMGMCRDKMIYDKTANDRQRKKEKVAKDFPLHMLRSVTVLGSQSPEYMMKKVAWCYNHNLTEVSR